MAADPNWFYSSLAQSAASIIGVVAAVAIARLQQQVSTLRSAARDLTSAAEQVAADLSHLNDILTSYVEQATGAIQRLRPRISTSTGQVSLPAEHAFTAVVHSERIGNVEEASKLATRIEKRLAFVEELRVRLAALQSATAANQAIAANAFIKLKAAQLAEDAHDRHLLQPIIVHANELARAATQIETDRSLSIATITAVVLVWLAFFGVLCPLERLAWLNGLPGTPLSLFSIGVAALPLLVLYEIRKLYQLGKYSIRVPPGAAG